MNRHTPTPTNDLEEAAQGQDLFRAPGGGEMIEHARDQAEASGWLPLDLVYDWPPVDTRQLIVTRRQDLYDAMRALEASAARASGQPDWVEVVRNALDDLESCLARHVAEIESPDGLFAEVLDRAPHLAPVVDSLRREHEEIEGKCRMALEMTDEVPDPGQIRRTILDLLGLLAVHRQTGAELLFDAYNVDLAGGE